MSASDTQSNYDEVICPNCGHHFDDLSVHHSERMGNCIVMHRPEKIQSTHSPQPPADSDDDIGGHFSKEYMDAVIANRERTVQPPALSDAEIDALQSHFVNRNTHLHPVFDQAKRANALAAEVERLREESDRVTGALSKTVADQIIRAESAERRCAAAVVDAERWRQFLKNPYAAWDSIRAALDVDRPAQWEKQANEGIDLLKDCRK